MVNETIEWGNVWNFAEIYLKVDSAMTGGMSVFFYFAIFLLILGAFNKRYESLERGLVIAGFGTAIIGFGLTVFGILPWQYAWMSVVAALIGFLSRNLS